MKSVQKCKQEMFVKKPRLKEKKETVCFIALLHPKTTNPQWYVSRQQKDAQHQPKTVSVPRGSAAAYT
jgi:hypothetical protein